jgi:hypothetical protein
MTTSFKAKLATGWTAVGRNVRTGAQGPAGPMGPFGSGGMPLLPRVPISTASWAWLNQKGATLDEQAGTVLLSVPVSATESMTARVKTLPTGTPIITTGFFGMPFVNVYSHAGLILYESATGKAVAIHFKTGAGRLDGRFAVRKNTSLTAFSAEAFASAYVFITAGIFYVRAAITATQYALSYSYDGLYFHAALTENKNAFFTTGPDQVGIMGQTFAAPDLKVEFLHWSEN